jgi:hypothetical protein
MVESGGFPLVFPAQIRYESMLPVPEKAGARDSSHDHSQSGH